MLVISHTKEAVAKKDETIRMLIAKLSEMTADRNEWRDQHENLLAMYQAEGAKKKPKKQRGIS